MVASGGAGSPSVSGIADIFLASGAGWAKIMIWVKGAGVIPPMRVPMFLTRRLCQ